MRNNLLISEIEKILKGRFEQIFLQTFKWVDITLFVGIYSGTTTYSKHQLYLDHRLFKYSYKNKLKNGEYKIKMAGWILKYLRHMGYSVDFVTSVIII